jgi:hypothetical protein
MTIVNTDNRSLCISFNMNMSHGIARYINDGDYVIGNIPLVLPYNTLQYRVGDYVYNQESQGFGLVCAFPSNLSIPYIDEKEKDMIPVFILTLPTNTGIISKSHWTVFAPDTGLPLRKEQIAIGVVVRIDDSNSLYCIVDYPEYGGNIFVHDGEVKKVLKSNLIGNGY